jgi:putative hemolysin
VELSALYAELDADEAEAMRPAMERMQHQHAELLAEKKRLQAEVAQLERMVNAQQQLLAESRAYLLGLRTKRAAEFISHEIERERS